MYATQELRDEHEGILVVLRVLERLAHGLDDGRIEKQTHLEQIVDFLHVFVDTCHHGKEENELFPTMVTAGLSNHDGLIAVLLKEHAQGRLFVKLMTLALQEARLFTNLHWRDEYATAALGYTRLLRAHIQKENDKLFTVAEQMLSPEAHVHLAEGFACIEHERIGEGVHEKYHAMIHALRDEYLAT